MLRRALFLQRKSPPLFIIHPSSFPSTLHLSLFLMVHADFIPLFSLLASSGRNLDSIPSPAKTRFLQKRAVRVGEFVCLSKSILFQSNRALSVRSTHVFFVSINSVSIHSCTSLRQLLYMSFMSSSAMW